MKQNLFPNNITDYIINFVVSYTNEIICRYHKFKFFSLNTVTYFNL